MTISSTGWIYGTPTVTGTFTITFKLVDNARKVAYATLTLTVAAP
jgi:hypothetical protein